MEALACQSAPARGRIVDSDSTMPPEEPLDNTGRQQEETTEIDVVDASSPRKEVEQAGTVATDLALAAEQVAVQAMYDYQVAAQGAPEHDIAQPPLHLYSNLPREWPMDGGVASRR